MKPSRSLPLLLLALVALALGGCSPKKAKAKADPERPKWESLAGVASSALPDAPREWATPTAPEACEDALKHALAAPSLGGAPELERSRAVVLLYAKAEPVVFVEKPLEDPSSSPEAVRYRSMLRETSSPWSTLQRLWTLFSMKPDLGRSVLLRDGYLYAEKPELAFALVDLVSAQLLFSDDRIWIQRGERLLNAERNKSGTYVFADGPERGQRVRLLLFDRIGAGTPPAPLHRDFRALRTRLGFDRVAIRHLGEQQIVADLRYGSVWVPTLLKAEGAHLTLGCELVNAQARPKLLAFRAEQAKKERQLEPLRRSMLEQVEDGLPFDEPLTEYGQQDGRLRREWLRAYESGKTSYELNGDRYYVFNAVGRPLVPQVCVDFVFDTFERASGTSWRARGEPRERVLGKLDFATLSDETRRRATSFIELAESRPEAFDVYTLPEGEHLPFKYPKKLSEYLVSHADLFEPGDVVMIRGYAPWDKRDRLMHFHSFFVYETDPVTGQPITLAGNPGRPLLQTWQFEAFRTPERSIWYRIRPKQSWLGESVVASSELPLGPPVLASD